MSIDVDGFSKVNEKLNEYENLLEDYNTLTIDYRKLAMTSNFSKTKDDNETLTNKLIKEKNERKKLESKNKTLRELE